MQPDNKTNSESLPEAHLDRAGKLMFAILLLSYVINAMDRQLFSVLAPEVRNVMGLSLQEVGFASTVFTLGMGLAGLPTAILMSRLSRKNVSLVGLGLFSLSTLLIAYAQDFPQLLLCRFLSGVGEAMQLTAILAIGTSYFHNNRAFATGALNFTFGIGAVIGPNLGAWILKTHDWQWPFISFGLAGVPLGILILICVRNWFSEAIAPTTNRLLLSSAATRDWTGATVILGICTMLVGLVIYGYLGLYPTFLRDSLGFTPSQAAFAISFYGFGAFLSILGGWLGDRFDYRRILFIALLIAAVCGSLLFTSLGKSLILHATLSFVFGASISGMIYVNLAASIIKSVNPHKASLGAGIFVACLYIPAAFAGYLLAVLRISLGWTTAAQLQLGALAVIAAALVMLMKQADSRDAVRA